MSELFDFAGWMQWFAGLERPFVFLLALPFVVAVIGLWSALADRETDREDASLLESERARRAARERRREDVGRIAHHGYR